MTDPTAPVDHTPVIVDLARDLLELIEAIDRRLPQIERAGELGIARDAAALRSRAVARLADLGSTPS